MYVKRWRLTRAVKVNFCNASLKHCSLMQSILHSFLTGCSQSLMARIVIPSPLSPCSVFEAVVNEEIGEPARQHDNFRKSSSNNLSRRSGNLRVMHIRSIGIWSKRDECIADETRKHGLCKWKP